MTDEVFQMMHWYCARVTPSRNTALEGGSFCNSAFFLQNIHYVNAVSRTISVEDRKANFGFCIRQLSISLLNLI